MTPPRILTVVEEPLTRFLLKSTLRSFGYEVEEAASGEEAWSHTKQLGIRLVIADWKLPGLDGLELCKKIRAEIDSHSYFVLLTEEEPGDDYQTRAIEAGVDDFLAKPVIPQDLRNRLRIAERILDYTLKVRQLESFLPICGLCNRVRNDEEYWSRVESYLAKNAKQEATRGICPDCAAHKPKPIKGGNPQSATNENPPTSDQPRPTLAMIAGRLQVSTATVSMALRNNPRISERTRAKVQALASKLGYTPNPEIGKVMHHLRTRRRPGFQSVIVALTTFPDRREPPYLSRLIEAMQARATETGYGFTTVRVKEEEDRSLEQLQRILVNRGTEGIVALPMTTPLDCLEWLDWSDFSAVAASHGILAPALDRVVPNWHGSALLALGKLHEMGCERIGAVFNSFFDKATCHQLASALTWHAAKRGLPPISTFTYTVPFDTLDAVSSHFQPQEAEQISPSESKRASIAQWFSHTRPDGLLCDSPHTALAVSESLKLPAGGPPKIVTLNWLPDSRFPGVEEHPSKVATTVIDQLAQKIKTGEKGPPKISTVTKILGHWVDHVTQLL